MHLNDYVNLKDKNYFISTANVSKYEYETLVFEAGTDDNDENYCREIYSKKYKSSNDAISGHRYIKDKFYEIVNQDKIKKLKYFVGVDTVLQYLLKRYDCKDIETLQCRCPISLNRLNLNDEVTEEFIEYLDSAEYYDDERISEIIKEREDNNKRFTMEDIYKFSQLKK